MLRRSCSANVGRSLTRCVKRVSSITARLESTRAAASALRAAAVDQRLLAEDTAGPDVLDQDPCLPIAISPWIMPNMAEPGSPSRNTT